MSALFLANGGRRLCTGSDIDPKPWQGTAVLVHNRRNATRLYKPASIAWLGEGKATFSPADNRFVLVDSQSNPMHLVVWDLARNDTLAVGAHSRACSR